MKLGMNKKNSICIAFFLLLAITTILYLWTVGAFLIDPDSGDDIFSGGVVIVVFTLYMIPVYLVELDWYFVTKSLFLNWIKMHWINKLVNIIACVLSTMTLLLFVGVFLESYMGICIPPEIIGYKGVGVLIGPIVVLELCWGIVRVVTFGIQRLLNKNKN